MPGHDSSHGNDAPVSAIVSAKEDSLKKVWTKIIFDFMEPVEGTMLGREANLLVLGGDSIAAISLASLAPEVHRHALDVPDILRHPALRDMAGCMEEVSPDVADHQAFQPRWDMEFVVSPFVKYAVKAAGLDWSQNSNTPTRVRYAMETYPDGSSDLIIKMEHAVDDGTLFRIADDHF